VQFLMHFKPQKFEDVLSYLFCCVKTIVAMDWVTKKKWRKICQKTLQCNTIQNIYNAHKVE